jgi:hypothetical protein
MMRSTLVLILLAFLMLSCGGGGSGGGPPGGSGGPPIVPGPHYVDVSGTCAGRSPCHTSLGAALVASFRSQFEVNPASNRVVRVLRPNDPPDDIIVMPGIFKSTVPGRWALLVGMNGEDFPPGIFKVRITAEQGPTLTTISGDGSGPCIWINDYVDVEIKGFTITGCTMVDESLINEHHAIYINSWAHARVRIEGNRIVSNPTLAAVGIQPYYAGFDQVQVDVVRNIMSGNKEGVIFDGLPHDVRPTDVARIVVANNIIVAGSPSMYPSRGISFGPGTMTAAQNLHIDIIHNTVVGFGGFGIFVNGDAGETNVQNNIVFGNHFDIYFGTPRTTNNLVGETSNLHVTGNRVGDPLFADPGNGNFVLQQNSPAIDAGVVAGNPEAGKDLNGATRPRDGDGDGVPAADIGALEYVP